MAELSNTNYLIIIVFWLLPSLLAIGLAYRFAGQQHLAIVHPMIMILTGAVLFGIGNAGEMYVSDLQSIVLWVKIEYIGLAMIPPAWFALAHTYDVRTSTKSQTLSLAQYALLLAPSLVLVLSVWTNEVHHLFWQETFIRENSGFLLLGVKRGWLPYLWEVYSYVLYVFALFTFIKIARRNQGVFRKQAITLMWAFSIPFTFNIINSLGLWPYPNITAPLMGVTGIMLVVILLRHRLLEISPALRRVIMTKMPDPMFAVNERNELLDHNDEAQSLLFNNNITQSHMPIAEVLQSAWSSLMPFIDSTRESAEIQLGEQTWKVRKHPLDAFENAGYILTLNDISAQVESDRQLQATRQQLQNLMEVLNVVVFSATSESSAKILARNKAFDQMLSERADVSLMELAVNPNQLSDLWVDLKRSGGVQKRDLALRSDAGLVIECAVTATMINRTESGDARVEGIIEDVGVRKETERELIAAKNLAEQASQSKSAFLANMSHEIRTPLNGILPLAEILAGTNLTDKQKELVGVIQRSGFVLSQLLNDVLDVSKIEAGRLALEHQPFSLEQVCRDIAQRHEAKAQQAGVELVVSIENPDASSSMMGDALRVTQVIENLVSNAIKFTSKGRIKMVASLSTKDGRDQATVMVEDSGVGISPDRLGNVFDSFVQEDVSTTRVYGGTGLGLSISQSLAKLMQGELTVTSELGRGSVFTFTFPTTLCDLDSVSHATSESTAGPLQAKQGFDFSGLKILVAEDDLMNQLIITEQLAQFNVEPTISSNGEEALTAFEAEQFDVILMDCHMPVMDGYTAASRLRAQGHEVPIIALSANAGVLEEQKSIEAGCDLHLSKPINLEALGQAIRSQTKAS